MLIVHVWDLKKLLVAVVGRVQSMRGTAVQELSNHCWYLVKLFNNSRLQDKAPALYRQLVGFWCIEVVVPINFCRFLIYITPRQLLLYRCDL